MVLNAQRVKLSHGTDRLIVSRLDVMWQEFKPARVVLLGHGEYTVALLCIVDHVAEVWVGFERGVDLAAEIERGAIGIVAVITHRGYTIVILFQLALSVIIKGRFWGALATTWLYKFYLELLIWALFTLFLIILLNIIVLLNLMLQLRIRSCSKLSFKCFVFFAVQCRSDRTTALVDYRRCIFMELQRARRLIVFTAVRWEAQIAKFRRLWDFRPSACFRRIIASHVLLDLEYERRWQSIVLLRRWWLS